MPVNTQYAESVLEFHRGLPEATPTGFSSRGQAKRFEVMLEHLPDYDSDFTLLDYGCGLGQFYDYVRDRRILPRYTGVDINPDFIDVAQRRWPDVEFGVHDVLDNETFDTMKRFDSIVASGVFCYRTPQARNLHRRIILRLWERTKERLIFNVLSMLNPNAPERKHTLYHPAELVGIIREAGCQFWSMRHDYLPNDITVIMSRQ